MKILLISGHTSGYNASTVTGVNEGDLNIELVKLLVPRLSRYADVTVYPYDRDMYHDNLKGCIQVDLKSFDYILEIHFNAFNNAAHGTEVYVHRDYTGGTSVEEKILQNIVAFGFRDRGLKRMHDLQNMNTCLALGVDYSLLEVCFYDNLDDMGRYKPNKEKIADAIVSGIVEGFGLAPEEEIPNPDAVMLREMSTEEYIELIGAKATEDQRKNGMLACVTVAQTMLESAIGKSELACGLGASEGNIRLNGTIYGARNICGLKARISEGTWESTVWDGRTYRKQTAEQNADGSYKTIIADFRAYDTIDQCLEDRAQYFSKARLSVDGPLRYPGIVGETDYEKVIDIIVAGDFATSHDYKENLIARIKKYNLCRFNLPQVQYEPWIAKVINAAELNVRRTPNGDIMELNLDTLPLITVIGEEKDSDGDTWYRVTVGETVTGYVWREYVSR